MTVNDNFSARPSQGMSLWFADREAYDNSVEAEVKRRFANNRGRIPANTDFNTLYGSASSGAWSIEKSDWGSLLNKPELVLPSDPNSINLLVFSGRSTTDSVQILITNQETWIRLKPGNWGLWKRVAYQRDTDALALQVTSLAGSVTSATTRLDDIDAAGNVGPSATLRAAGAVVKFGSSAATATTILAKDATTPRMPASTTKVLAALTVHRAIGEAHLDDDVTVLPTDPPSQPGWSGNEIPLQEGDILSYRELLLLAAVPSHNQGVEILARAVGEQLPGEGTPREKFLAKMNEHCTTAGFVGASFDNPAGASSNCLISPNDLASLTLTTFGIASIRAIFANTTCDVQVRGPNARVLSSAKSILEFGMDNFPDHQASKAGSWGGEATFTLLFRTEHNAGLGVAVIMGSTTARRYYDLRTIVNAAKDKYNSQFVL